MKALLRAFVLCVLLVAAVAIYAAMRPKAEDRSHTAGPVPIPRPLPKLLDVGTGNCAPCRKMAPILQDLGIEFADQLVVEVVDLRTAPEARQQYNIELFPTQIFYDAAGHELMRHEGIISRADILKNFRKHGVNLVEQAAP